MKLVNGYHVLVPMKFILAASHCANPEEETTKYIGAPDIYELFYPMMVFNLDLTAGTINSYNKVGHCHGFDVDAYRACS